MWSQKTLSVDVFGGYALTRYDDTQGYTDRHIGQNGWEAAVNVNLTKNIAVVSDFGGNYGTHRQPPFTQFTCLMCPITFPGTLVNTKIYTYMFGPQVSAPFKVVTPFGHALFGRGHIHQEFVGVPLPQALSNSGFAYALGGGVDANITKWLAWRVQGDYLRTSFYFNDSQTNFRAATGAVFRFGKR